MVNTIKFSEMKDGGNLNNDDKVPGLLSGGNVLFNNPWVFLPSGSTAERPPPSVTINYRLRFNTDNKNYEYYDPDAAQWIQLEGSATLEGPFLTYTADPTLPDAQNLGLLANGILKQSITSLSATLDIAVNGTDFYGPGFIIPGDSGGTGISNTGLTINLGSAVAGYVLTSDASGNATWQHTSASGSVTELDGDSGSATPTAGIITITGSTTGLTFTGSMSTLSLSGIVSSTSGGLGTSSAPSAGQIPIGTSGNIYTPAEISSGTNILVTSGSGSITVSITGIIAGTNGGTGVNNGSLTINLGSATAGYVLTSDVSGNATWQHASSSGAVTSIDGDIGTATPTAGVIKISGGLTGLTFTASSNIAALGGILLGDSGGTGVVNTGLTINLSSGGAGKVLSSDVSGNASWALLSSLGITSAQGTANQVLVNGTSGSPVTGEIILTTPQDINTNSNVEFSSLLLLGSGTEAGLKVNQNSLSSDNGISVTLYGELPGDSFDVLNGINSSHTYTIEQNTQYVSEFEGQPNVTVLPTFTLDDLFSYNVKAPIITSGSVLRSTSLYVEKPTGASTNYAARILGRTDIGTSGQLSINDIGVITSGSWNGSIIPSEYGGTGINNGVSTITIGGDFEFSGAFSFIGTLSNNTSVTFPISGTLATVGETVVSLQGTANQVLVNGTSGSPVTGTSIVLTTPQNLDTGAEFQVGNIGLGVAADSNVACLIDANKPRGIYITGTISTEISNVVECIRIAPTIDPADNTLTSAVGITCSPIFNATGGTITNAYGIYGQPLKSGSGTITNLYGAYYDQVTGGSTINKALYAYDIFAGSSRQFEVSSSGNIVAPSLTSNSGSLDLNAASGNNSVVVTPTGTGTVQLVGNVLQATKSSFLVTLSSSVTNVTGAGVRYTIVWDNEKYDRASNFSSTTFTAPVTGIYNFNWAMTLTNVSALNTAGNIRIAVSNTSAENYYWNIDPSSIIDANTSSSFSGSLTIFMTANDTATLDVFVASGTQTVGILGAADPATFWSGYLVG